MSKTFQQNPKKEIDQKKIKEEVSQQNPQDESLESLLKNDEKTLFKKITDDKKAGFVMRNWTSTPTKNKFSSCSSRVVNYNMSKTFHVPRREEEMKNSIQISTQKKTETLQRTLQRTPQGTPSKYIALSLTQK